MDLGERKRGGGGTGRRRGRGNHSQDAIYERTIFKKKIR